MKHPFSDKYNIAWFKLAEYASRGEKERAIGIYKLLVLSFDDVAFSYQLEGDLLMLFQDETALEKYIRASILYIKENRFIQAAGIYEHLTTLKPENEEYLNKLIEIYENLNIEKNKIFTKKRLCKIHIKNNKLSDALEILKQIEEQTNDDDLAEIYESLSIQMIKIKCFDKEIIIQYLKKSVDLHFNNNNHKLLQEMLIKLEALDSSYYSTIIQYLRR